MLKKYLHEILIIVGFAVLALIYCYPALQGKKLLMGDTISWIAMSQEGREWHEKTGEDVMWSNSMFGGMPTFTYYLPGSNNYIYAIQTFIVGIFAKPAHFLFLAMLCFFILMRVLNVNKWLSAIGAVAYAFSTFNVGIIVAGHETEMFSIGYMPAVIAGLLLIYRARWWTGIPLLGISLALLIGNGHYQVTYYLMIVIFFMLISLFITALKDKTLKQFFIASAVSLVTAVIALGTAAPGLLSTADFAKETMRGGTSELSGHDKGKKNGGLDKDYAFLWSNGVGETFSFLVPFLYGGSSDEPADAAPKLSELTGGQIGGAPMYWGPQPFLAGPVYFGAVICFLFVLSLMVVRSRHKWWILAVCILAVTMSWGKNFAALNYFLFDTLPMLNKFRTPTMVLVIPELMFPLMALWALNDIVTDKVTKEELWKMLKIAAGITAGLCLLLAFGGSMFFSYTNHQADARYQKEIVDALREDRASYAMKSALTSAAFILVAAALIWAYIKNKVKANVLIIGIGVLVAADLLRVDSNYLNSEKYQDESDYEANFQKRKVDEQILQDKDPYYRVMDVTRDIYNDAMQAYYHKCIGGYNPAKLEIYQDLIDRQMDFKTGNVNAQVLNMLNTKYFIFPVKGGEPGVQLNREACGNAWFVNEIKWANTADDEMSALNAGKIGDTAKVAGAFEPLNTAVLRARYKDQLTGTIAKDSSATVTLAKYGLDNIAYKSSNSKDGFAVFSDIYYKDWHAFVDGKETPVYRTDYVLRGIRIPAGQHNIEFRFTSPAFNKGNKIGLISSILLIGICLGAFYPLFRKNKQAPSENE
ncbi:MAG: YfhO family protein [Bacteroidetes bacterium]|nr:YfhO family protein [Bacteroidota bacterium]